MESTVLNFQVSTNLKNLIGKDLVTSPIAAIFELVKNSYDADAKNVRIKFENIDNPDEASRLIISDDGDGMSYDDLLTKWMVIGTNHKKERTISRKYNRRFNGDKGIGRFSADRLGHELYLYTYPRSETNMYSAYFDWDEFENYSDSISSIDIKCEQHKNDRKRAGVDLVIVDLRDEWILKDINQLIRQLRKFKSPFDDDQEFNIIIDAIEYGIEGYSIEPYELSDIATGHASGVVDKENCVFKLDIEYEGLLLKDEIPLSDEPAPYQFEIYFFNQYAKGNFSKKFGMNVKQFGNVRLYHDSFRVHPFGEDGNDWLDIDLRHAQGYARTFGTRDLIGYVQVTRDWNPEILQTTDRQGIVDNLYFRAVKEFVIKHGVRSLERQFFVKKAGSSEQFKTSTKKVDDAMDAILRIADELKKEKPEVSKALKQQARQVETEQKLQRKIHDEQKEIQNILKRAASKEYLLHSIIHQALINTHEGIKFSNRIKRKIGTMVENEHTSELIDYHGKAHGLLVKTKSYLLSARDKIVNKRVVEEVKVKSLITDVAHGLLSRYEDSQVAIMISAEDDLTLTIDRKDLETIVENFVSNSMKAIRRSSKNVSHSIMIEARKAKNDTVLIFKDTADGVPEHLRDRIFDSFFSTVPDEGFGMGLSIVDEIVRNYNGSLNLIENDPGEGAEFLVRIGEAR